MATSNAASTATEAALDEAGRVVKRQRTCSERVCESLDQLIALALKARAGVAAGEADAVAKLQSAAPPLLASMNASTKELHGAVNKLSKALDRAFDNVTDVCSALRDVHLDQTLLNKVRWAAMSPPTPIPTPTHPHPHFTDTSWAVYLLRYATLCLTWAVSLITPCHRSTPPGYRRAPVPLRALSLG